jgi:hypothetical protein
MIKCTAINLDTLPTTMQQTDVCSKMPGYCLMVAAALTMQAIRSSESTGNV